MAQKKPQQRATPREAQPSQPAPPLNVVTPPDYGLLNQGGQGYGDMLEHIGPVLMGRDIHGLPAVPPGYRYGANRSIYNEFVPVPSPKTRSVGPVPGMRIPNMDWEHQPGATEPQPFDRMAPMQFDKPKNDWQRYIIEQLRRG